jgi:hypothetical protein
MNRKYIVISLISFLILFVALNIHWDSTAQVFSQQKGTQPPDREENAFSRLSSPHEIARYINEHNDEANLNDLWDKLSVETEFGKPGKCGCRGDDCPGTCKAEVIQIDSDSGQDNLFIVRVTYAGEAYCWFLVVEKESDLRLAGVVESLENQYKPPQHRIVKHGAQRWLVIMELCGRGSGFVNYVERWYQINRQAPKEVLSYGVSGHSVQGETSDYEFSSKVYEHDEGNYRIVVQYKLLTEPVYEPDLEWRLSQKHKACFVWDSELEQFILDRARSDLGKSEESPIILNINRRVHRN